MKHKKVTGTAMSMPAGIALGVGVSVVITLIGAMVVAWLVISERLAESAVGYGSMVILLTASLTGCLVGCGMVKSRRLMVCSICVAGYYLALLAVALLFGGQFEGIGVTALFVLLGGAAAVILGLVGNKSGARKYKFRSYR